MILDRLGAAPPVPTTGPDGALKINASSTAIVIELLMSRNVVARLFIASETSPLPADSIWKMASLAVFRSHFTANGSRSIFVLSPA